MLNYSLKLFSYKNIFDSFVNLDLNNKLPSRILLSGQEGIGKTTFSLHLINYLFTKNDKIKYNIIENRIHPDCKSHNLVKNLSHPNFYYIAKVDGKKNIDIEQIRNMINFLNKSSFNNQKKIILIDGAEDLNASSSNSLLKSLEESNANNIFILNHNINRNILSTIKSRCLIFNLNFNYNEISNIISEDFGSNLYDELNDDFKFTTNSPKFLINHILFIQENKLDL